MNQVRPFVEPADAEVLRPENLPQLVSDQIDDRLEAELSGEAALDQVDERELHFALREHVAGRWRPDRERCRAPGTGRLLRRIAFSRHSLAARTRLLRRRLPVRAARGG